MFKLPMLPRKGWHLLLSGGAVLFAAGWFLNHLLPSGKVPHNGDGLLPLGNTQMATLAVALAVAGLLLWWGLEQLFWRKYFPTQDTPESTRKRAFEKKP